MNIWKKLGNKNEGFSLEAISKLTNWKLCLLPVTKLKVCMITQVVSGIYYNM